MQINVDAYVDVNAFIMSHLLCFQNRNQNVGCEYMWTSNVLSSDHSSYQFYCLVAAEATLSPGKCHPGFQIGCPLCSVGLS